VPFAVAAPLTGQQITENDQALSSSLDVSGASLVGAVIITEPMFSDGRVYRITMTAVVRGSMFVIAGWTMAPVG
jgi:hypothetical protein